MPQLYGNGLCSRSTSQWLMGAADRTPCQTDNRLTELAEMTWTTEAFDDEVVVNGPIAASLHITTTAQEAVLVARLTMVGPDGRSRELSTGLASASFRAVDKAKSRIVDGINLQPWHPYTKASVLPVTPGEPMRVDVEIFPTAARVPKGWSLRLSVGTSDFPHAASPLPAAVAQQGGVLTVLHDAEHPSSVAIPFVGDAPGGGRSTGRPEAGPIHNDYGSGGDDGGNHAAGAPTLPATGGAGALPGAVFVLAGAAAMRRRRRS